MGGGRKLKGSATLNYHINFEIAYLLNFIDSVKAGKIEYLKKDKNHSDQHTPCLIFQGFLIAMLTISQINTMK